MGNNVRTLEDDKRLKKLEEMLVELKLLTAPKLEIIPSTLILPHLEGPLEMNPLLPPSDKREVDMVIELTRYWRPTSRHDCQLQEERKVRRENRQTNSM